MCEELLQLDAELPEFLDFGRREPADPSPLAPLRLDEPLGLQESQGLAYHHFAHAIAPSEVALAEVLPLLEAAAQDGLAEGHR